MRRLARHSAIYGLGGLVSRILATILLPLYTHYLPPRRVRPGRDRHRGDRGARDRPADGDRERVLPLLLRREGAAREADGRPHLVLVHDGDGDGRARRSASSSQAPIAHWIGLGDRPVARPRRRGRPVGADELPAADRALPRRGAIDRLRDRERRRTSSSPSRRWSCSSPSSTGARSGSSSATSPARSSSTSRCSPTAPSSSASSSTGRCSADAEVRDAARPVRARALGDQLRRPRVRRRGTRATARSASTRPRSRSRR